MSDTCETMKVKSPVSDDNPAGCVLINKSDFDPTKHELFDVQGLRREHLDEALAALPGGESDVEYVVRAMRSHFGELFTDGDEAKVRALVKAPIRKASDGLTVPEIKDALAAKNITIPDGVTLKADLAALLDAAA
jgi:hypothetical protein